MDIGTFFAVATRKYQNAYRIQLSSNQLGNGLLYNTVYMRWSQYLVFFVVSVLNCSIQSMAQVRLRLLIYVGVSSRSRFYVSKARATAWNDSFINGIHPAASARRHVLMFPASKKYVYAPALDVSRPIIKRPKHNHMKLIIGIQTAASARCFHVSSKYKHIIHIYASSRCKQPSGESSLPSWFAFVGCAVPFGWF